MTRRNNPFDDDSFNDIFEEMFEQMNEMIENMGAQGGFGGFRMTGGPDGANFESFGDAEPFGGAGAGTHADVLDEGDEVRVVADLPGVAKDDIRVSVSGDELKIQASGEDREYNERVGLPAEVNDDTGEATYNNGVLEIAFEKDDDTENGKEIEIE